MGVLPSEMAKSKLYITLGIDEINEDDDTLFGVV
jgi:hypothetical protein